MELLPIPPLPPPPQDEETPPGYEFQPLLAEPQDGAKGERLLQPSMETDRMVNPASVAGVSLWLGILSVLFYLSAPPSADCCGDLLLWLLVYGVGLFVLATCEIAFASTAPPGQCTKCDRGVAQAIRFFRAAFDISMCAGGAYALVVWEDPCKWTEIPAFFVEMFVFLRFVRSFAFVWGAWIKTNPY